jgi:hypothetical protein
VTANSIGVTNLNVTGTLTGGAIPPAGVVVADVSDSFGYKLCFSDVTSGTLTQLLRSAPSFTFNPASSLLTVTNLTVTGTLTGGGGGGGGEVTVIDVSSNSPQKLLFTSTASGGTTPILNMNSGVTFNPAQQLLTVTNLDVTGTLTGGGTTVPETAYTFSQAAYYGTTPTFNLLNMAAGAVTHAGGSLAVGVLTGVNQRAKTYHVLSNPSSVGNGQSSGWVGTSTFTPFFVGLGLKVTYGFALLDTSTNAATRTMIGFGNFNTFMTLNATSQVGSVANQFIGIVQEVGSNEFVFYTKGPGATGTGVASTVSCTTPTTGWYTVTFQNEPASANVTITLTMSNGLVNVTDSHTFLCGGANTIGYNQACYPILQRSMASAGGTTGSAILAINGLKFYTR